MKQSINKIIIKALIRIIVDINLYNFLNFNKNYFFFILYFNIFL